MLVLTRKACESIVIGNTIELDRLITVTVLEIRGGRVRLGFDLPGDVAVHRMEVWQRVNAANPDGDDVMEHELVSMN